MLALIAALASVGPITEARQVNVDDDRAFERLVPQVVEDEYGFEQRRVVLEDNCGRLRVLGVHDTIAVMEARDVDGVTSRPEIIVEGRSGASSRFGTTRVIRMDGCRRRVLFNYGMGRPPYRAPRGWYVATYDVRVTKGRLRLIEYLARNHEPAVAVRRTRTSRWRYADGRFVRRSVSFGTP